MKVKNGDFVMPGEKLGIIEQYLPGKGTYENEGDIEATVLGTININSKMKTISVEPKAGHPATLEVNDKVYGQITDVKPQRVNVKIDRLENTQRELSLPYMGSIHISKAKEGYLDKISDAFRIGDIIKAEVIKITGDNVELTTVKEDCGVLKAMCTRCREYMSTTPKRNELQCKRCNKKERREVSSEYVNK